MENSIKDPDLPPVMEKNYFFLKLDHFLELFEKSVFLALEIQKK